MRIILLLNSEFPILGFGPFFFSRDRFDFFDFFRYALATIATIYATVVTLQSLWGWYVWLAGSDKYVGMLRRYLLVHGLRLRFRRFWGDVLICALLCAAFLILCRAHAIIYDIDATVNYVAPHH